MSIAKFGEIIEEPWFHPTNPTNPTNPTIVLFFQWITFRERNKSLDVLPLPFGSSSKLWVLLRLLSSSAFVAGRRRTSQVVGCRRCVVGPASGIQW